MLILDYSNLVREHGASDLLASTIAGADTDHT
jgi:hypothetical protein